MRILIHTDSPTLYSGLSRCGRELAKRLYEKTHQNKTLDGLEHNYEIFYAAWHYAHKIHQFPYFLYPLQKGSPDEPKQFQEIINDCQPDVIISIGDLWNFHNIQTTIRNYKEEHKDVKWILWLTIDGENLHPSWQPVLDFADDINVFSYFGKQQIFEYVGLQANVIYPGVDKNVFRSITPTIKENSLPFKFDNTFVVLNINQNTDRKNIPLTLEGFKDFAQDKDDVFLLLITDPEDPFGYDLWHLVKKFNIKDKVAITKEAGPLHGMSDAKLNLIYNLVSVSINTSIGEGLSLPTLEAMAVGVPVVSTNYAALTELLGQGGGLGIEPIGYLYGFNGIKRALVSRQDVADKLNILYQDYKTDKTIHNNIKQKSQKFTDNLSWDNTTNAFIKRIECITQKKVFNFIREKVKLMDLNPLIIIPTWGTHCGIAEYTRSLFDAIRLKNQQIVVFSSNNYNEIPNILDQGKYNLVHIQHEFSFFKDKEILVKLFEEFNKRKIKKVLTMHTLVPGAASHNELLLTQLDDIIVHCDVFKSKLQERFNESKQVFLPTTCNIEVIPMGCGNQHPFDLNKIKQTKKYLDISEFYPIVGSFGFLRDQKGFQNFLLTIKLLKQDYPNVLALLVCPYHEFGSKTYDEAFFNFVERQNLDKNVLIIREYLAESKLLDTLQCADLFVLNYHDSPMGGGISAAVKTLFRVQRPIIVNDTIAFLDLKNEVLKIKSVGPESLIEPIKNVLNNQELANKLVFAANNYIERNNWDITAQKHLDLYFR